MHTHGHHAARLAGSAMRKEAHARQTALDNFGTLDAAEAYGRLVRMYGSRQNGEGN